ncbi:hypothetical protein Trco_001062 [Trichoderma cornu-damae]|uniref:Ubiquitin-like domain-containing protein n=1 Tax=Trichoderma cornu-damae TaxID=654480 RepID=A0A9P8QY87_9HYPO|nr:hypothetical protein Trco_001062 [Trichoderma cornu-damae]
MVDGAAAASIQKKRLPFKPTALRNAAPLSKPVSIEDGKRSGSDGGDDDGLDLFRQAREMAPIMAAERERRLNKKKQKQADEERRKSEMADKQLSCSNEEDASSFPVAAGAGAGADTAKRLDGKEAARAIPVDDSPVVDEGGFSRDWATPPPSKRSRRDSEQGSRSSKRRRSAPEPLDDPFLDPTSQRSMRSDSNIRTPSKRLKKDSVTPGGVPIISLDSDSDSDSEAGPGPGPGPGPNANINALESFKRRQDGGESVGSGFVDASSPNPVPEPRTAAEVEEEEDEFDEYVRKAEQQRARDKDMMQLDSDKAEKKEAAADIMVGSNIPGTKVAHIKYQFNRPLRLIRDSWIALQRRKEVQLPITSDDDIILTWQKKKVYTYSSLLGLGIRPQGDGRIIADEYRKGGLSDGRTKVILEAWTKESFSQMELEEELRLKREAGELSDQEPTQEEQEEKRTRLRVRLRAKDMEDVKLTVLPETTVETLIIGFRTQRHIGSSKDVGIWFDGERLEEHQTMEEADINDMDTLEVHTR